MSVYERDRKGSEWKELIVSYNVDVTQNGKIPGHGMMQHRYRRTSDWIPRVSSLYTTFFLIFYYDPRHGGTDL